MRGLDELLDGGVNIDKEAIQDVWSYPYPISGHISRQRVSTENVTKGKIPAGLA